MVLNEVETLLEQQPLLTKSEVDGGLNLIGKYKICNQLEDEVFEDYFSLEIFVPDSFPDEIPTVQTTDRKIRANNYRDHLYTDGQFCLEIDTAIATFLQDNPNLLDFLSRYLDTYLCGFLFYKKHKRLPFGEHKHGIVGLLDFYCELFVTADKKTAYFLLDCLFKDNHKGHIDCPCQSGKRFRNCHRDIMNELRASRLYDRYKSDYETIIATLNKR
jgi:hypothetical protein